MKYGKRSTQAGIFLIFPILAFVSACTTMKEMREDPFYYSFYAKAEIIMTEDEKKEYRRLPGNEAKKEFIREFWLKRDWDPATKENEGRIEFERRISFANNWFYGRARSRGKNLPREWKSGVG